MEPTSTRGCCRSRLDVEIVAIVDESPEDFFRYKLEGAAALDEDVLEEVL